MTCTACRQAHAYRSILAANPAAFRRCARTASLALRLRHAPAGPDVASAGSRSLLQRRFYEHLCCVLGLTCVIGEHISFSFAADPPTVRLDDATFIGVPNGLTNKFLGIPFAKPPVGDLRFRLPVANAPYSGTHNATQFGYSCAQQGSAPVVLPPVFDNLTSVIAGLEGNLDMSPVSEDCLTVNVWTPANLTKGTKLPVAVWIYGGGFEGGSSSTSDASALVNRSIELGEPIVYVSLNYRLNAFGFLASKEVKAAGLGNIGLHDQRQALRWVQKYISAFNGDPSKVTIWGQSAGASSVSLQLLTNGGDTEGLFRGAFMESGYPWPVGDITGGQPYYEVLVNETGCRGKADTLQCLREAPCDTLMKAVNDTPSSNSYQSLNLAWMPRADGVFLPSNPQELIAKGSVASVPFVAGEVDDEGTGFSLSSLNVTTNDEFRSYIQQVWFPKASAHELDELLALYPQNYTAGSPFDTGDLNAVTPEYKRIAAFQGDMVFQAPRRFLLDHRAEKQKVWGYLSKRFKSIFAFGSVHGTDLIFIYFAGDLGDYLINFVNHLDPNVGTNVGPNVTAWPQYNTRSREVLTLLDGTPNITVTNDSYRAEPIAYLTELSLKYPL
ncbi:carotenoid ester lipase precursor [Phanerochaete sordida]|uniref:Carotenoid ester lipase n=1 Tax=Phanerochaete sordida TaxID=48140 RepID=A0A9P3GCZ8_9APHY|nr:carotenoid ester lipase precursor [Phanerochaete sordida]